MSEESQEIPLALADIAEVDDEPRETSASTLYEQKLGKADTVGEKSHSDSSPMVPARPLSDRVENNLTEILPSAVGESPAISLRDATEIGHPTSSQEELNLLPPLPLAGELPPGTPSLHRESPDSYKSETITMSSPTSPSTASVPLNTSNDIDSMAGPEETDDFLAINKSFDFSQAFEMPATQNLEPKLAVAVPNSFGEPIGPMRSPKLNLKQKISNGLTSSGFGNPSSTEIPSFAARKSLDIYHIPTPTTANYPTSSSASSIGGLGLMKVRSRSNSHTTSLHSILTATNTNSAEIANDKPLNLPLQRKYSFHVRDGSAKSIDVPKQRSEFPEVLPRNNNSSRASLRRMGSNFSLDVLSQKLDRSFSSTSSSQVQTPDSSVQMDPLTSKKPLFLKRASSAILRKASFRNGKSNDKEIPLEQPQPTAYTSGYNLIKLSHRARAMTTAIPSPTEEALNIKSISRHSSIGSKMKKSVSRIMGNNSDPTFALQMRKTTSQSNSDDVLGVDKASAIGPRMRSFTAMGKIESRLDSPGYKDSRSRMGQRKQDEMNHYFESLDACDLSLNKKFHNEDTTSNYNVNYEYLYVDKQAWDRYNATISVTDDYSNINSRGFAAITSQSNVNLDQTAVVKPADLDNAAEKIDDLTQVSLQEYTRMLITQQVADDQRFAQLEAHFSTSEWCSSEDLQKIRLKRSIINKKWADLISFYEGKITTG